MLRTRHYILCRKVSGKRSHWAGQPPALFTAVRSDAHTTRLVLATHTFTQEERLSGSRRGSSRLVLHALVVDQLLHRDRFANLIPEGQRAMRPAFA